MNRKLFLGMSVAAGMLLTASCSQGELETAESGNEAQVTFSLGLEDRIATRTISDGKSADKLVYAVFDEGGNRITTFENKTESNVTFPTKVTLSLAKGQTYKVAFWAQDADCSAYTVDDDMNVTVNYTGANNDEARDAFFKTTDAFTVTGSTSMDVVLKRPFAQINVGVETTDWTAAVASGVTIQKSSAVIKNAATKINLVTGAVSDPTEVTYSLADIPAEEVNVDADGDGVKETYKWLSMSYILVNDGSDTGAEKATLEGLKFTFNPENGNDITLEDGGLNSVPVQRNWRTNIIGKLLTGDITFNISIDEMYNGDHIYPDGSAQELAMAAANGGEVTLAEDVVLSEPLVIADGKTVKINLNGKKISNTDDIWNDSEGKWSLISVQGGTLTIENGEIVSKENDCYPIDVRDGGTVIIESGTYVGNIHAVYVYDGKAEINGGTFSVQQKYPENQKADEFVINCYDANYKAGKSSVSVTGGTFIGFNPANCKAEGDNTDFVTKGYTSVKVAGTDNNYAVVPGSANENTVAAVDATSLAAAASSNESQNIVLTQNIELDQALTFKTDVVLDGGEDNNVQITGKPLYFQGENTTIKGIKFNNGTTGTESSMYFSNNDTKNILIEDCEFLNAKWDNIQLTKAEESVMIRNCTFKNTAQGYRYIHLEIRDKNDSGKYATTEATLEITGCTFENVSAAYCKDSAITILGFSMNNMTIANNTVKGDGANNLTTNIIWICDGTDFNRLMSVDDINQAFTYVAE